jgi:hypothetical protein
MSSILFNSKFEASSYYKQNKISKIALEAIDYYKSLTTKFHINQNNALISSLKTERLHIYLNIFQFKEIQILSKIIGKYSYFKSIMLCPNDPNKSNNNNNFNNSKVLNKKTKNSNNANTVNMERQQQDLEKAKKEEIRIFKKKLEIILAALSKHLKLTQNLTVLKLFELNLSIENASLLASAIKVNNSLSSIIFNNCNLESKVVNIVLESFLSHEKVQNIEWTNSSLSDSSGSAFSRIISRQTQLRDQIIWMHGLRNERPLNSELATGLVSINLNNNKLTSKCCEPIVNALVFDNYLRKISLSENLICEDGCKLFNKLLKTNNSLINVDLRKNPGFLKYQSKLSYRLAKNIINLIKSNNFSKEELVSICKYICFDYFNFETPKYSKYNKHLIFNSLLNYIFSYR